MSTADPQTWHYGLVSRWWAEFNLDGPEIDYFRPFVEAGQPALDAACGTGRLLVPYLQAGLDVDGSDISPDMLDRVRERCEREGLARRTSTRRRCTSSSCRAATGRSSSAAASGSGGTANTTCKGCDALHEHLEAGGTLVLDRVPPYADPTWPLWRKEERAELPRPWRDSGDRRALADGSELELRGRLVEVDPLEQCVTREIHALLWQDGEVVTEEKHVLKETFYFTHELELMLGGRLRRLRGPRRLRRPSADGGRRRRRLHRPKAVTARKRSPRLCR